MTGTKIIELGRIIGSKQPFDHRNQNDDYPRGSHDGKKNHFKSNKSDEKENCKSHWWT